MISAKLSIRRRGDASKFIDRIKRAIEGPSQVKVGFPAGTESEVLTKAAVNEFGTSDGRIPERPFMRNSLKTNRDVYQRLAAGEAKAIVHGRSDMRSSLTRIGIAAQGHIQKEIASSVPPPNAPSTIERKGSSTTLIDTGEMRQSVTHEVED